MAEKTVVHLLRHGEVHNPEKVLYGRLPGYRLSETGEAMALAAAEWLADKGLSHVLSSPLERAQQTAAPIAGKLDLPIETDDRLIEAGNAFEGLRVGVGDGALRSPQHWWKLRNPFRPSWGEPYVEIAARMLAAVEQGAGELRCRRPRVRGDDLTGRGALHEAELAAVVDVDGVGAGGAAGQEQCPDQGAEQPPSHAPGTASEGVAPAGSA